jgi:tripartite-type tricarboxylate transporter receptor subunit TctC
MTLKTFRAAVVAATALVGLTSIAQAAFPEKDIEVIIPYGPGGGFDRAVRAIAPFLEKHLPGDVHVLPVNTPGAGGRKGATTVYRADPDGYTIGIFNMPGFLLPAILGEDLAYDLSKISWLGRVEANDYVLVVNAKSDIHTLDDLKALDRPVILSTAWGSTVLAASQITAEALGLKNPTYVTGYPSTSDYQVGLVRGDGQVALAPVESVFEFISSGDLRPIAVTGANELLPDTPTFSTLGYPDLDKLNLERLIGGPPNLDPEAAKVLEESLAATLADPEFLEAAKEALLLPRPLNGADAASRVTNSIEMYEHYKPMLGKPAE